MPDNPVTRDQDLFPEIDPYVTGRLAVDARHALYWECCGNAAGAPLVFLHGGPGGGCLPHHRRYFDPAFWRIVLFDQRGAGRSTPIAELADNTTAHLVADLGRLREHLRIERWLLFGGSWGSTLALAYAEAHPQRCLGLVLRGIFLARPVELNWFMHGMRNVFPEAWRAFAEFLPERERGDLLGNYYRRLTDPDPAVHLPAAQAWDRYEGACSTLLPPANGGPKFESDAAALAIARIEAQKWIALFLTYRYGKGFPTSKFSNLLGKELRTSLSWRITRKRLISRRPCLEVPSNRSSCVQPVRWQA